MTPSLVDLENEWRKDVADFPGRPGLDIFGDIVARHSEPQRRYHGLGHLSALFHLIGKHAPDIQPGSPARLAVWWHDAIYDPQRQDNEIRSAVLADLHLRELGADDGCIDYVSELIRATKNHWAASFPGYDEDLLEGNYFLDADIAILGAPFDIYDRYAADVRKEYSFVSDAAFRAARAKFLEAVLSHPRLFRTETFEFAYAAQARINMRRELATLA